MLHANGGQSDLFGTERAHICAVVRLAAKQLVGNVAVRGRLLVSFSLAVWRCLLGRGRVLRLLWRAALVANLGVVHRGVRTVNLRKGIVTFVFLVIFTFHIVFCSKFEDDDRSVYE